ncbi:MAG: hypothetical protein HY817_00200 [Candidatus Abawacabacteria bacterium]|nr:hypothetical protein [Candidatus Abawacabacteria bacterium]
MGKLLDFEIAFAQKGARDFVTTSLSEFAALEVGAQKIAVTYRALCRDDVRQAIDAFVPLTEAVRAVNPCVETMGSDAIVGGPNHTWVAWLLNSLGKVYEDLSPEVKKLALEQVVVRYLDERRSDQATNHVELIEDPALAGDIVISRPEYWPERTTLATYERAAAQGNDTNITHATYERMRAALDALPSPFWAARVVARKGWTSPPVQSTFYREHPVLMKSTLRALAGIIVVHGKHNATVIEDKLTRYDWRLVKELRENIAAKTWTELAK